MGDVHTRNRRGRLLLSALAGASLLAAAGAAIVFLSGPRPQDNPPSAAPPPAPADIIAQVHAFCGACHDYPPPDTFPRSAWKREVERGFSFAEHDALPLTPPPLGAVVRYYEERAPLELPAADVRRASTPLPVTFERVAYPGPPAQERHGVSNVNLVHLHDKDHLDILACDMLRGLIMVLRPYQPAPAWQVLYHKGPDKGFNPAHAEVIDLDGDGINDILVANLGNFLPTDARKGSVVWLRGRPDGTFTPFTLLDGVGRVADVQAGHFRGPDKPLDLVVAAFGWQTTGEIIYL